MSLAWRSTVDPTLLEPGFVRDLTDVLGKSGYGWWVTYGFRTYEEQLALYRKYQAGGPRAAPPGKSAHEFGLAVDVVLDADPILPGLQPTWNVKLAGWVWLFATIAAHPRLKSGVKFGDGGHIERYKWQEHTNWRTT